MFAAAFMFPSTGVVQGIAVLEDGTDAIFASRKEAMDFVLAVLVRQRRYPESHVGVVRWNVAKWREE